MNVIKWIAIYVAAFYGLYRFLDRLLPPPDPFTNSFNRLDWTLMIAFGGLMLWELVMHLRWENDG